MLQQTGLVDEGMDRQQLDRVTRLVQVLDHRGGGEPAVGAAQFLRHILAQLRQAFDVRS